MDKTKTNFQSVKKLVVIVASSLYSSVVVKFVVSKLYSLVNGQNILQSLVCIQWLNVLIEWLFVQKKKR